MRPSILFLGALFSPALPSQGLAVNIIDLSDSSWTLSSIPRNITVPGKVPSQVHLDLFAAGVIPDPYYGLGDFELRWVTLEKWRYETEIHGL